MPTFLPTLVMVLPAAPLIVLSLPAEYWGRIYLLWGTIFAILSCVSALRTIRRSMRQGASRPSVRQFFMASLVAWLISLVALTVINFTPLCLGQDNGDGSNSAGACVFLAMVWSVYMSLLVVPLMYVASVIAATIWEGSAERWSG